MTLTYGPKISEEQQRQRTDKTIRDLLPAGYTYGYIGNLVESGPLQFRRDDRAWYIFAPHPGRPGEWFDRVGGYATQDREALLLAAKAINLAATHPAVAA